jgi:hypothetical protein
MASNFVFGVKDRQLVACAGCSPKIRLECAFLVTSLRRFTKYRQDSVPSILELDTGRELRTQSLKLPISHADIMPPKPPRLQH